MSTESLHNQCDATNKDNTQNVSLASIAGSPSEVALLVDQQPAQPDEVAVSLKCPRKRWGAWIAVAIAVLGTAGTWVQVWQNRDPSDSNQQISSAPHRKDRSVTVDARILSGGVPLPFALLTAAGHEEPERSDHLGYVSITVPRLEQNLILQVQYGVETRTFHLLNPENVRRLWLDLDFQKGTINKR